MTLFRNAASKMVSFGLIEKVSFEGKTVMVWLISFVRWVGCNNNKQARIVTCSDKKTQQASLLGGILFYS
jgi:hypothetical protein